MIKLPNILNEIDNQYPYLTRNEKKIAQYILNSPHKVVDMNSHDIAELLETSPSSVIRFSKKVTKGGFHELKIRLSKFLPKEATSYNVELVDNESTESLKNKLHSRSKAVLNNANEVIDNTIIDQICDLFKRSETIFIYGYGASFVVALIYIKSYLELAWIFNWFKKLTFSLLCLQHIILKIAWYSSQIMVCKVKCVLLLKLYPIIIFL